ncbi:MAG TPA: hypothetical protein VNZ49_01670 [Bacteroidia bacterium]|jgi:hypothetical protein|nr:hypothetical protein [Bacteroidia bacterium]
MFRTTALFSFVFTLLVFTTNAQEKAKKINYAKEGYVKAMVIKYKVESCGFLIELADKEKTKLAPDKLSDDLKKDKLKIWIKYTLAKKQLLGTCMAGKQCEVTDIKKRK